MKATFLARILSRIGPSRPQIKTVCAWCPGSRAEAIAREYKRRWFVADDDAVVISHGMCASCAAKMEAEYLSSKEAKS